MLLKNGKKLKIRFRDIFFHFFRIKNEIRNIIETLKHTLFTKMVIKIKIIEKSKSSITPPPTKIMSEN